MSRVLHDFALHRLEVTGTAVVKTIGEADPAKLDARARDRLLEYIENVEARSELDGRAASAWWLGGGPPAALAGLQTCPSTSFEQTTVLAMGRLAKEAKGNAASGIVVFIRYSDAETQHAKAIACFKLDPGELHEVQWQRGAPAVSALAAVDVLDVLPQPTKLQKAALLPDPTGAKDMRVVDDQLRTAAQYWMNFLGARAHPGERERLRRIVRNVEGALETTFQVAAPDSAVAQAVARAAGSSKAISPTDFLNDVAAISGVNPQALAETVQGIDVDLVDPGFTITPDSAQAAKTIYDLGGGLTLSGPRGVVEERVEVVYDGQVKYLQVRVTQGPTIKRT